MAEDHNVVLTRNARVKERRKAGLEQAGKRPQRSQRSKR